MTKEEYRNSILQLVYGAFKSHPDSALAENESSIINGITDLIVEDSFRFYRPDRVKIIPSNFNVIWSYYEESVNNFFQGCKQGVPGDPALIIRNGDLYHYLVISSLFSDVRYDDMS